ncbi:1,4-alpha-glucan branching protein GlgB [Sulfobacillus sp. hq2]|uniref:1,4-alpha-glucan branching protein GlgB n=1 Tax=Sulfobacillus TaxID=28033 RepID=UPI000CD17C0B|nr:1,4-alpha-glucan branching protein GlgB [Sulfobacillus sp. hq2]POB09137.1 1,4-alpha-glucan branching enzyme [Sulfobacillus sp. hq2]
MHKDHLDDATLYLFNEGSEAQLYRHFGAQRVDLLTDAVRFAVWAPAAAYVSVVGTFNAWDPKRNPLQPAGVSGVHVGTVEGVPVGSLYKYHIETPSMGFSGDKADPVAFGMEIPPKTASVVTDLSYTWHDAAWLARRQSGDWRAQPMSIYEVHLGSWRKHQDQTSLSYQELADELVDYVKRTGFTHVEFMPVMEHPYYGSWGYQTTSYFAPSRRYGTPQDLMYLIDRLHQADIGVLLDWVPSHFATDDFGLGLFDGTHLYEHADPRQGIHPQWHSYVFNYGRNEVRSFLVSSAMFWVDIFHADGLRVDAVSSMLYLNFGREEGQWVPNRYGGYENLEAIAFLRQVTHVIHETFPGVLMIAEESTAWPGVSRPAQEGGLGFDLKWDMGWMHDTLDYMALDPIYRRYHHDALTFRPMYAQSERFILPLSHDEVVHQKGSLLTKMSGDTWQKFANLRLLLAYQYAVPGKKLLFMGGEIGQWREWSHDREIDWFLLGESSHAGLWQLVQDLNHRYRTTPAWYQGDHDNEGFAWCDFADRAASVLSFFRRDLEGRSVLAVFNFTPVVRTHYRLGVPHEGLWHEVLNTDAACYGGSNQGNLGGVWAEALPWGGQAWSLALTLPPLAAVFFEPPSVERD